MNYLLTNIEWDTDGVDPDELELPTELSINLENDGIDDLDNVSDWLSDKYGWTVNGYSCDANEVLKP